MTSERSSRSFAQVFVMSAIVGGTAAVVKLMVFAGLLYYVRLWYIIASTLAYLIGIGVNFGLQKKLVFSQHTMHSTSVQFRRFASLGAMNLALNAISMYCLVSLVHVYPFLAQILTLLTLQTLNFFLYRLFVFTKVS